MIDDDIERLAFHDLEEINEQADIRNWLRVYRIQIQQGLIRFLWMISLLCLDKGGQIFDRGIGHK